MASALAPNRTRCTSGQSSSDSGDTPRAMASMALAVLTFIVGM